MAKATQEPAVVDNGFESTPFINLLDEHWNAGYQVLFVHTAEEFRCEQEISHLAADLKVGVVFWDVADGFTMNNQPFPGLEDEKYKKPYIALDTVTSTDKFKKTGNSGDYFFVFRDLDDFMHEPVVRRRLRTLVERNKLSNSTFKRPIVIISPSCKIHEKLKTEVTVLPFNLPDERRLAWQVEQLHAHIEQNSPEPIGALDPDLRQLIATNLLGLTAKEADDCVSRCIVRHSGFVPEMIDTIKDEKANIIKRSEVLTYIPAHTTQSREEIGGFDNLMKWLDERKGAYTTAARELHIDAPRGVILLGVPGTGKSVAAKAISQVLSLPGYILDIGGLLGSLVGESESRTRSVLQTIDAQNGCVLLIDEADKMFGNVTNSTGDSGVFKRVFGQILTWLSDNRSRAFVVLTLNSIQGIPPEMLRAGRFDRIFYTDLPSPAERRKIMEIHLKRRKTDPETLNFSDADWTAIVEKTDKYVGAELEQVICTARYKSFASRAVGTPTLDEMLEAANSVIPMARRNADQINAILDFCKDTAEPVSSGNEVSQVAAPIQQRSRGLQTQRTRQVPGNN